MERYLAVEEKFSPLIKQKLTSDQIYAELIAENKARGPLSGVGGLRHEVYGNKGLRVFRLKESAFMRVPWTLLAAAPFPGQPLGRCFLGPCAQSAQHSQRALAAWRSVFWLGVVSRSPAGFFFMNFLHPP